MKGILICGGIGSRLRPLTDIVNKSLLPVYDKPLILYPLQVLLDAGIKDIAVVTGGENIDQMEKYLGTGSRFGCTFTFKTQNKPGGIAQALGLAEDFAAGESVCAILGDNIFFDTLTPTIKAFKTGGHVFLREVMDPERFGVAEIALTSDKRLAISGQLQPSVLSIEEKPKAPKSNLAVTGCYLYDNSCFEIIRNLKPSARGELEITDVSKAYLEQGKLRATILKNEWVDAGTFESLYRAAGLVKNRRR